MKINKVVRKFASLVLGVVVVFGTIAPAAVVADVTLVQPEFTESITVNIPEVEGLTITFTNVFGFFDFWQPTLNPATSMGEDIDFSYAFNIIADSIVFSQDITFTHWTDGWTQQEETIAANTPFVPPSENWERINIQFGDWQDWTASGWRGGITLSNLAYMSTNANGNPRYQRLDIWRQNNYEWAGWDMEMGIYYPPAYLHSGEWVLFPPDPNAFVHTNAAPPSWFLGYNLTEFDTFVVQTRLGTASDWAVEHILRAKELELVREWGGYGNMATLRQDFARLAVRLYEKFMGEIEGRVVFEDNWSVDVEKAAYIGIVTGVGENQFNPWGLLTREQAAVMLARIANAVGQPLAVIAPDFNDNARISDWALEAVGQVQAAGIMGGVGDGMFDPNGIYTREQSIITILRLFDILQ